MAEQDEDHLSFVTNGIGANLEAETPQICMPLDQFYDPFGQLASHSYAFIIPCTNKEQII